MCKHIALLLKLCFLQSILLSFCNFIGSGIAQSSFLIFVCQLCQVCGKILYPGVPRIRQYHPKLILLTLPMYHLKQSLGYHLELHYCDDHTVPKHYCQTHTLHNVSQVSHIFVEVFHLY